MKTPLLAIAFLTTFIFDVNAAVILSSTRYVYKERDKEITIKMSNIGDTPALTQIWIDKGDPSLSPADLDVPFVLSNPLSRLDPKQSQNVRVVFTGDELANDRETVFWLNMLEVPPKPRDADEKNYLQLSVRTRVKLFYRPSSVRITMVDAVDKISASWNEANPNVLEFKNPTALFVSLAEIKLKNKKGDLLATKFGMIEPFKTFELDLKNIKDILNLDYSTIAVEALDDLGAVISRNISTDLSDKK